jgi:hypothetical protein
MIHLLLEKGALLVYAESGCRCPVYVCAERGSVDGVHIILNHAKDHQSSKLHVDMVSRCTLLLKD